VTGWSIDPVLIGSAVFVAAAYRVRAGKLAREGRPVALLRQISFNAGLVVVVLALVSPIDTIGETRLFYVHMIQHLMLGDLGRDFAGEQLRARVAVASAQDRDGCFITRGFDGQDGFHNRIVAKLGNRSGCLQCCASAPYFFTASAFGALCWA